MFQWEFLRCRLQCFSKGNKGRVSDNIRCLHLCFCLGRCARNNRNNKSAPNDAPSCVVVEYFSSIQHNGIKIGGAVCWSRRSMVRGVLRGGHCRCQRYWWRRYRGGSSPPSYEKQVHGPAHPAARLCTEPERCQAKDQVGAMRRDLVLLLAVSCVCLRRVKAAYYSCVFPGRLSSGRGGGADIEPCQQTTRL